MHTTLALGLVNSGKSTLLSALADRPGLFAAGDVPRVTRAVQSHRVGPVRLVDTPGLDASAEDAAVALQAAEEADTLLWCHSLRLGELRPTEIEALLQWIEHGGRIRDACFVLTHRDDVPSGDYARTVSQGIARQLKAHFQVRFRPLGQSELEKILNSGGTRWFRPIAAKLYWQAQQAEGTRRHRLIARSGVSRLRAFLFKQAHKRAKEV